MREHVRRAQMRARDVTVRVLGWMLLEQHALRGSSATRIAVGIAMLGILVSNFAARHVLWGEGSFWTEVYREESPFGWLVYVLDFDEPVVFTLVYLGLIALGVAVVVGWRTRLTTMLLALGMTMLVERAPSVGDQGDNIARIGLFLLVLMASAEHWSLDARRRARTKEPVSFARRLLRGDPVLPDWITTLAHNVALVALAAQICILYTASALFKVQGSQWQDGTALHYPLQLHEYGVFPALNDLIVANPFVLTVLTYLSVFIQLFFAVGLLHPVTRRLFLIGMVGFHAGIALLMGLPWFSLSMLAFDAIFVSDRSWRWIERAVRVGIGRLRGRRAPASTVPSDDESPPSADEGQSEDQPARSQGTIAERRAGQPPR